MNCPTCQSKENKVLDTRQHPNGCWLKRRRQCECGNRWWTVEVNEIDLIEEVME